MATPFTRNHRDHSNDTGYQFEFFCDKCGNGYRSSFQTSGVGVAAKMLKAAGSFLGGGMWRAGYGADHLKDALRGPAWDKAFESAIGEMRPRFRQCTRCGQWVCPEVCWNEARTLCETCAPDLGEEAAAAQARAAADQVQQKARDVDHVAHVEHDAAADGGLSALPGPAGVRRAVLRGVRQAGRRAGRGQVKLLHRVRRDGAGRLALLPRLRGGKRALIDRLRSRRTGSGNRNQDAALSARAGR